MARVIGFIGAPGSGKTTQAAKLFAHIKSLGIPAEYVGEYARAFISFKKWSTQSDSVTLTEEEQLEILWKQQALEEQAEFAMGERGFVIVDGSFLNTMLYIKNEVILDTIARTLHGILVDDPFYDKIFYCPPLFTEDGDPNRIHNLEEIKLIDSAVSEIIGPTIGLERIVSLQDGIREDTVRNVLGL